jgi:16S rRNA processing protein RimM
MANWHVVGRIRDAHGIKGEVFVALKAKTADWLDSLEELGLASTGSGPFESRHVTAARPHKDGLIVRLENIDDRNAAELLRGKTVAIPESYLVADPEEGVFLHQLKNLSVLDPNEKILGKIVDFGFNGAQDLIVVQTESGRFEVPFVDEFIVEFDYESGRLVMDLPEGLLGE